jgi:hypothetical protein
MLPRHMRDFRRSRSWQSSLPVATPQSWVFPLRLRLRLPTARLRLPTVSLRLPVTPCHLAMPELALPTHLPDQAVTLRVAGPSLVVLVTTRVVLALALTNYRLGQTVA